MVDSILARPQRKWTLALGKTMTYTTSMNPVGAIEVPLQSWNDLIFSEVRGPLRSRDSDGASRPSDPTTNGHFGRSNLISQWFAG